MNLNNNNYFIAIKSGKELVMSNKKFVITQKKKYIIGQYLSSNWFNPLIKPHNYKKDIWLAIIKIPKNTNRQEIASKLFSTNGENWKELPFIACFVKYNWNSFYEDILDGSQILRSKENNQGKLIEVSLPCYHKGDKKRMNFNVAMSFTHQEEKRNYSNNELFKRPKNPENSPVLQVTIQCPSFRFITSEN